jgi:hypothetical protein
METYVILSEAILSISNFTILDAFFRYKIDGRDGTNYTFCREIFVTGDVKPEEILFYDKNWLKNDISSGRCTLDVLLEDGLKKSHKKLRFSFLADKELGNYIIFLSITIFYSVNFSEETTRNASMWKIFTYLDVSTPGEAILHWQKPVRYSPEIYMVTAESNVKSKPQNLTGSSAKFEFESGADWYNYRVKPLGNECEIGCQEGGFKIVIGKFD